MIDFTLTAEQQLLQKTAREFAEREIRPVANRLRADARLEPWSLCEDLFRRGADLGFVSLLVPEEHGGLGRSCLDLVLLQEELARVEVSVAADYFNLTAALSLMVSRAGSEAQRQRILAPLPSGRPRLLAGALSEPDVAGSDLFSPHAGPGIGIRTQARREGGGYVLRGRKSAFITNAGAADGYFVLARSDPGAPPARSLSMFYIPADAPGLACGRRTELVGWQASHHAELMLDDVRVGAEDRIGAEGGAGLVLMDLPEMAVGLAAAFVGLGRAAYEYALRYAERRTSWGRPIVEHQAVALKLADMAVDTQAARLLVWEAAHAADTDRRRAAAFSAPAAKTFAVDVAIRNASRAVEILGAYGVTTEYEAARFLQDAWIGYACDFTRDMLRLGMVPFLPGRDPA